MTKSLPLLSLALALAGCGTVNRGMESVHQPIVQRTDFTIDLAANPSGLAEGEALRLEQWFRSINLAFGDRVGVDDASGSLEVRNDVATVLARRGLMMDGTAPVTAGALANGAVRVVVTRSTANVPGCPDWSRPATPEFAGSTMSNFGCALNATLATLVADPMDLVRGRETVGAIDPNTSYRAISALREAPVSGTKGLKVETTSKVGR